MILYIFTLNLKAFIDSVAGNIFRKNKVSLRLGGSKTLKLANGELLFVKRKAVAGRFFK
jgi:hypothetical protein